MPLLFSRSCPLHNIFDFQNRLTPKAPFHIPFDELQIKNTKRYNVVAHDHTGKSSSTSGVKWYPEVQILIDMGPDNDWLPREVIDKMKEKFPYYYRARNDVFRIRVMKGATFEASLEHAIDNMLHIFQLCHRLTSREDGKFVFNFEYYKYKMPFIFRRQESFWLDKKRQNKKKSTRERSAFNEPFGKGEGFKMTGGYQPHDGPGGNYHHAETLAQYDYKPDVSYTMDPYFRNPAAAESKLGGGCSWV